MRFLILFTNVEKNLLFGAGRKNDLVGGEKKGYVFLFFFAQPFENAHERSIKYANTLILLS